MMNVKRLVDPILRRVFFSKYFYLLSISLLLITADAQSQSNTTEIPAPDKALTLAEGLTPEELTQVEVNDYLRDRLRLSPAWQPILEAVRQDLIKVKWGETELENPVWEIYGEKAYPLLDYYTGYPDDTRRQYGLMGIRALGKPYTTIWLTKQLRRGQTIPPGIMDLSQDTLEQEFGLDNPEIRSRILEAAKEDRDFSSFRIPKSTAIFIDRLLELYGENNIEEGYQFSSEYNFDTPESIPELQKWLRFEKLNSTAASNLLEETIRYFSDLPEEIQKYILVTRLGKIKAGEIHSSGRIFLREVASLDSSEYRSWAIAELDRHGDPNGTEIIKEKLDGDLSFLNDLTGLEQSGHAHLLLVAFANKYPKSRFTKAAREYGNLKGYSYFNMVPRDFLLRMSNLEKSTSEQVKHWQQWLEQYSDHPGADDATHNLATNLLADGQVLMAFSNWFKLAMQQPLGDGDAYYLAWRHIRLLMDFGLTIEELNSISSEKDYLEIRPLLRYALAVRHARAGDYATALEVSSEINLETMSSKVFETYYPLSASGIPRKMQVTLTQQRERWRQLAIWQQQGTPKALYNIASSWAEPGGWEIGYFDIWQNYSCISDAIHCYISSVWPCDFYKVSLDFQTLELIKSNYRNSVPQAVAASLYKEVLNHSDITPQLREKALYMLASTLLVQWQLDPGTAELIHPLPGFSGEDRSKELWEAINKYREAEDLAALYSEERYLEDSNVDLEAYEQAQTLSSNLSEKAYSIRREIRESVVEDYQAWTDEIIVSFKSNLKKNFSESSYLDDILFFNYLLSHEKSYLKELLSIYPDSDYASEAKFLISHE